MRFRKKYLWVVIAFVIQQITCYLSLDIFDFFYLYEDNIESGTFAIDDLPFSLKGIVLFIIYFLFVFGVLVLLNIINLAFFWNLNSKFNPSQNLTLGYIIACFCILISYISAVSLWVLILTINGFPDYFPDNNWRGLFLLLKPYHPGVLLFLLLGNVLFYSFYVPAYNWINRDIQE